MSKQKKPSRVPPKQSTLQPCYLQGKRILILDDESGNASSWQTILEQRFGAITHTVVAPDTGEMVNKLYRHLKDLGPSYAGTVLDLSWDASREHLHFWVAGLDIIDTVKELLKDDGIDISSKIGPLLMNTKMSSESEGMSNRVRVFMETHSCSQPLFSRVQRDRELKACQVFCPAKYQGKCPACAPLKGSEKVYS